MLLLFNNDPKMQTCDAGYLDTPKRCYKMLPLWENMKVFDLIKTGKK
jgi:hypothetical protein